MCIRDRVRTSNVSEISGAVRTAKEKNSADRQAKSNRTTFQSSRKTPGMQEVLSFPKSYFTESGDTIGHNAKHTEKVMANEDEWDKIEAENTEQDALAAQTAFPNSIHFRSLPRKIQDHIEKKGKDASNADNDWGGTITDSSANNKTFDIFLYLPHNLSDSVQVSYTEAEGGAMEKVFARLTTMLSPDGGEDQKGVQQIGGSRNVDMNEIMKVIRSVLPGAAMVQSGAGNMTNPMKFQTLEGIKFRDYQYKFTLRPETLDDSREIYKIIQAFKWSALPGTAGENGMIWTFPNEWAIGFQGPVKDWLEYPLTSVCTGVEVDYSEGGAYALMESGAPQSIELTLSFTETAQLSRRRYIEDVAAPKSELWDRVGSSRGASQEGTKIVRSQDRYEKKG